MKIPKKVNETENFTHTHTRDEWCKSCDKRKIRVSSLFSLEYSDSSAKNISRKNYEEDMSNMNNWENWEIPRTTIVKSGRKSICILGCKIKAIFLLNIFFATVELDFEPILG